jgi:hypothetical protein
MTDELTTASTNPGPSNPEIRLSKTDRPRRIDQHIDYFGDGHAAATELSHVALTGGR